jgi:hypothetical protein
MNTFTKFALAHRIQQMVQPQHENHPWARVVGGITGADTGASAGILATLGAGGYAANRALTANPRLLDDSKRMGRAALESGSMMRKVSLPLILAGIIGGGYGGQALGQRLAEHIRKSAAARPENPAVGSIIPLALYGNPRGTLGDAARSMGRRALEAGIGGTAGYAVGELAGQLSKNPNMARALSRLGAALGGGLGGLHGGWAATKNFNKRRYPAYES